MIKVIAFDFVGVLVKENDFKLNDIQTKIERLFGPNKSDAEFLSNVKQNIINISNDEIINMTSEIISNIYDLKVPIEKLETFKAKYPHIKLVIATNHVSFVQSYIKILFKDIFDKIYISANLHETKPNTEFYTKLIQDLNISYDELLFLDDSEKNIIGAKECNIPTIHVTRNVNILEEIQKNI